MTLILESGGKVISFTAAYRDEVKFLRGVHAMKGYAGLK
jgi:hypothetical protein